ncbi:hypothetical protein BDN70DRAFT_615103 [Pholiota conissans]|uniref:Uncharacterized protein n=1 Tax=Pholiota conissans TaxID=109636 RepID=A0A9P5YJL9_9AGAR|nr:hypothetical protein BDN70DRAFT_615103 [Pholiota conissans]
MQSKIEALNTDLRTSIDTSKNLEEERNRAQLFHAAELEDAQIATATRIRELENDLECTETELTFKSETIVALTTTSEALESRIGALETELFVRGQELDHERTQAKVRIREAQEQRDNSEKHTRDLEEEQDKAIVSSQGANDACTKAQERIHALEDELSSQSRTVGALTASSIAFESKIEALTTNFRDVLAVRKSLEEERDNALIRALNSADAHEKTQTQNQALEDALQYSKAEISENSRINGDLRAASKGLQSQIDALTSNLNNILATSKLREEESDAALSQVRKANEAKATPQVHVCQLEDALESTKSDPTSKSKELEALTAGSSAQQSEIASLKANLRSALDLGRDNALARVRDSEDADRTAQAHIQALKNSLQSTQARLNSKAQEIDALTTRSKGLRAENDALKVALHDAPAVDKQREEERNAASSQVRDTRKVQEAAQVHIKQLEGVLQNVKAKLVPKSQAFDALRGQGSEANF